MTDRPIQIDATDDAANIEMDVVAKNPAFTLDPAPMDQKMPERNAEDSSIDDAPLLADLPANEIEESQNASLVPTPGVPEFDAEIRENPTGAEADTSKNVPLDAIADPHFSLAEPAAFIEMERTEIAPLPPRPLPEATRNADDSADTDHDIFGRRKPTRFRKYLVRTLALAALLLGIVGALFTYAYFRANTAQINADLKFDHWSVVNDGKHNSNTDLIYWRNAFYMISASSPWHFGSSEAKLVLRRSLDARSWETIAEFHAANGNDIRDPKFAAIGPHLYLYTLINDSISATPESTFMSRTDDGTAWTDLCEIEPKGWLFWRPKTRDGLLWYCTAYWHQNGKSALFQSADGERWEQVSEIFRGEANDETDFEFLPDGRIVATARLEVIADSIFGNGDANTLIATARPPYTEWKQARSPNTRLDGPCLFAYHGSVYAVGRRDPDANIWPTNTGSLLGKKRTALYKVENDRLAWISDLPSAGDTAYAGVATIGENLFASYYTSDITRDWPWIIGMLSPTEIRMARIELNSLPPLTPQK